jgi:hypothetical protein
MGFCCLVILCAGVRVAAHRRSPTTQYRRQPSTYGVIQVPSRRVFLQDPDNPINSLTLGHIRLPLCPPHLVLAAHRVSQGCSRPARTRWVRPLMITSQITQLLEQT